MDIKIFFPWSGEEKDGMPQFSSSSKDFEPSNRMD